MNSKTKTAVAVLSLIASTAAFSQAKPAEPDYTLSYNVGVVSDYRFRGIEQTAGAPSIQGGIDFAHKSGFYAGAFFADNIKWIKDVNGADAGNYEIDLYAGFKGAITKDIGYDLGVISYMYPGNTSGKVGTPGVGAYRNADTTEIFAGVTYSIASFKMYQSTGDFLGNINSNASRYYDLSAAFDLGSGFTLTPHYGYQTIPNQNAVAGPNGPAITDGKAGNYSDYALTLAKDFGNGLVVSLAAVGTDAKKQFYTPGFGNTNRFLGKDTVVLGLKYNF